MKNLDTFPQKFAPVKSSGYTLSGEIPSGIVRNESDVASEERLVGKLDFHSHVKCRIHRYKKQAGGSIGHPM